MTRSPTLALTALLLATLAACAAGPVHRAAVIPAPTLPPAPPTTLVAPTTPTPAPAGSAVPDRGRAAESFDDGVAAYAQGDYARAILAFERAYAALPSAEALFNLARAHDSLGHEAAAAAYYAAFLRDSPATSSANARGGDRAAAQGALARLAPRVGWLRVRGFGRYVVDGSTPPGADPEALVAVAPGSRTVRLAGVGAVGVVARAGEAVLIEPGGGDGVLFVIASASYGDVAGAGRRSIAQLP